MHAKLRLKSSLVMLCDEALSITTKAPKSVLPHWIYGKSFSYRKNDKIAQNNLSGSIYSFANINEIINGKCQLYRASHDFILSGNLLEFEFVHTLNTHKHARAKPATARIEYK